MTRFGECDESPVGGTTVDIYVTDAAKWRRDATVRVLIASDGSCLGGLVSAVNSVLQHTRRDVKFYIVTTAKELPHLRCQQIRKCSEPNYLRKICDVNFIPMGASCCVAYM
jgi:hypothetical protein